MIRILFYITTLAFILGQIARIPIGSGVAVTLFDIAVLLLVGWWAMQKIRKGKMLTGKLVRPIGVFIGVCVVSLLINNLRYQQDEIVVAALYLLRWICYAGVYFVIKEMPEKDKLQVPYLLISIGIAQVIIGFVQYFIYPDLSSLYHLGWDEHLYRLFGSLLDPNFQGAVYVLLFLLLFVYTVVNIKKYDSYLRWGIYILLGAILLAIILTYSRSALLMLFASLITYALYSGKKRIIFIISGVTLLFVILFSNVYIEGLNPLRTASSLARISSMKEAVTIVKDHPVLGVGFNAYRYAQNRYGFRTSEKWMTSHADAGTDNSYLFILATTGIIGLAAYVYLLRTALTVKSKANSTIRTVTIISLSGIMVNCLFINSLFYPFVMYWLWVLLGLTENT